MIDIRDIQGNIVRSVPITQSCKKIEELMVSDYIQLSWNSDSNEELQAGCYIEHDGEKFSLLEPYKPTQKNEVEFTYTPQFNSKVMALSKVPFFFYTTNEGKTTKEPDWTLTSNPADFMKCVCDALKNETGEDWTYSIDASLPASASLSFNTTDIFSSLNEIARAFETEWYADKVNNILYLGKASFGEPVILEVGENIKVPTVNSAKEGYYTRFYAFGSTRNITQNYEGSNVNNLVNKRLTLDPVKYPNGYKDIRADLRDGEIFSKVLVFEDVYPSSNLSISSVRTRLMYRVDGSGNKIQIGTDENGTPIYDQYAIWYFKINGFEFDSKNIIQGQTLSVHFQTGALAGREFELKYYESKQTITTSDGLKFDVQKGDYEILFVEEGNYIIPSLVGLVPSEGDEVVLFNIEMPSEYTQSAYDKLESELDKEIERLTSNLNNYSFNSNPVAFNENNPNLTIGRNVTYKNGDETLNTRVIKLTTQLDFPIEQNITIGNEKIKGNTQLLKEEVATANKDLNLLSVFNDMTNTLQQSYARTQQMMLDGFASIKNIWQLREDVNGNKYIYSAFNVATEGGVSMYRNLGFSNIPSIYDGLPIDHDTIYWEDVDGSKVLKAKGGGGIAESVSWADITGKPEWLLDGKISYSEIEGTPDLSVYALKRSLSEYVTKTELTNLDYADKDWVKEYVVDINTGNITAITKQMVIEALGYTPYNSTNPAGYITSTALNGYATQDWVTNRGYLTSIPSEYITETELAAKGYATALSVNTALGNKVDKIDGKGLSTEDFTTALKTKLESLNNYNDTAISNAVTKLRNDFDALVEGDTSTAIDNFNEIIAFLNGVQDNQDLSSIIASIEQQIASRYTKPSGGIPKSDLVQAVQTSLGKADSALQSHQSIYTLTFQSGTFASGSFTANSGNKTINIPTTTSHISEGGNLYFTNARAVSALADTLKSYVTLSGTQTISGEKNFTGGLKVNGSPIVYDAAKKYWKLEGDLLITGGLTMYGSDSSFTPSTIMDAIAVDGTTISKEGGVLRVIGGGSGSISEITKQMVVNALGFTPISSSDVPTALPNPHSLKFGSKLYDGSASKTILASDLGITWDDILGRPTLLSSFTDDVVAGKYLPLSGGTLSGHLILDHNSRIKMNGLIEFYKADGSFGAFLGTITDANNLTIYDGRLWSEILHTGNYSSYALPLSGGTMSSNAYIAWNTGTEGNDVNDWNTIDGNGLRIISSISSTSNAPIAYSTALHVKGRYGFQLASRGGANDNFYIRNIGTSDARGWMELLHSGNYSSYALPLSGGTITGTTHTPLAINTTATSDVGLRFDMSGEFKGWVGYSPNMGVYLYSYSTSSGAHQLGLTDAGVGFLDSYTLIHSGNIGSQIVEGITTHVGDATNANGDIAKLNSYYSSKGFRISRFNGLNGLGTKNSDGLIVNWPLDHSYGQQWYIDNESHTIQTRYVSGGAWSDWKTIAFTDSNVASATRARYIETQMPNSDDWYVDRYRAYTRWGSDNNNILDWRTEGDYPVRVDIAKKLNTARTIWGQSFDGTGDVNGTLTIRGGENTGINFHNTYGTYNVIRFYGVSGENFAAISVFDSYASQKNLLNIHATGGISLGAYFNPAMLINSSGNVTIGASDLAGTSSNAKLYVDGNVLVGNAVLGVSKSTYNRWGLSHSSNVFYIQSGLSDGSGVKGNMMLSGINTQNLALLTIKSDITTINGNVGIGTTSPAYKLDVNGTIRFAPRTIWGQSFDGTGDVNGILTINSGGYIKAKDGYGYDRDVLELSSTNTFYLGYGSAGAGGDTYLHGNNIMFRCDTSRTERMRITSSGNVGIGTTSPSAKLDVAGNILATGITMYSQRSLKNVVDERGLSLSELSAIKPTRYTWKDDRDNRIHFGGIADDIQQVLPEVVYRTNDGVLTMDYGNAAFAIASSLIKPVIDHEQRIKALEKENEELKQEIKRLRA